MNGDHDRADSKDNMPLATKDEFVAWLDGLADVATYHDRLFTTLEADFVDQTKSCLRAKIRGKVSEHVFIPAALSMHGMRLYTGQGRQVFISKASSPSSPRKANHTNGAELAGFLRSTVYYLYHQLLPQLADVAEYTTDVEEMYAALTILFRTHPHSQFFDGWGLPQTTNRLGHNLRFLMHLHPAQSLIFERNKHGKVTFYTFFAKAAAAWITQCYKDLQSTNKRL
jgi:hypothetical protein